MAKLDEGIRRFFLVWHRRAGKDTYSLNLTAKACHDRVGTYYHMLPTQRQARRVIWNGINKEGVRLIDQAFPKELRKRTLEDEMMIEFKCGSIWQLCGSDNYDSLVGTNVAGMVFSEWSISNPASWDYMRPILAENDGWAIFIGTPRGKNFFYDQYQLALKNQNWYCSLMTVDDTKAIPLSAIEEDRASGMSEDRILQEYWCSFEAKSLGVIYDDTVSKLAADGRIGSVPYDPRFPVETAWDLGHRDATAIVFTQNINGNVHFIDYEEFRQGQLKDGMKIVREKPYAYSRHVGPHDLERFEYGGGSTPHEVARQHGFNFVVAPKLGVETGINSTRALLARARIDSDKCHGLIRALRHYHYAVNEDTQEVSPKPHHDWASHPCDAVRYRAVTPEGFGEVHDWARELVNEGLDWAKKLKQQRGNLGHNGGPPMDDMGAYDPLSGMRG